MKNSEVFNPESQRATNQSGKQLVQRPLGKAQVRAPLPDHIQKIVDLYKPRPVMSHEVQDPQVFGEMPSDSLDQYRYKR